MSVRVLRRHLPSQEAAVTRSKSHGARRQFHGHEGQLCVRSHRLSALKDHGLITSPAFVLMKAADRFANPTTAPNQLWQTDFTYGTGSICRLSEML